MTKHPHSQGDPPEQRPWDLQLMVSTSRWPTVAKSRRRRPIAIDRNVITQSKSSYERPGTTGLVTADRPSRMNGHLGSRTMREIPSQLRRIARHAHEPCGAHVPGHEPVGFGRRSNGDSSGHLVCAARSVVVSALVVPRTGVVACTMFGVAEPSMLRLRRVEDPCARDSLVSPQ